MSARYSPIKFYTDSLGVRCQPKDATLRVTRVRQTTLPLPLPSTSTPYSGSPPLHLYSLQWLPSALARSISKMILTLLPSVSRIEGRWADFDHIKANCSTIIIPTSNNYYVSNEGQQGQHAIKYTGVNINIGV